MQELQYKIERIGAENDHTLKANKLLSEIILKIEQYNNSIKSSIRDLQDTRLQIHEEYVNYFDRNDKLLLDRKLQTYEGLVDKTIEAGEYVDTVLKDIAFYKTQPFPYSFANVASKRDRPDALAKDSRKRPQNLILTDKQQRDKLVDSIFKEMRDKKKIPTYYMNSISRVDKLKLIRDHFQQAPNTI